MTVDDIPGFCGFLPCPEYRVSDPCGMGGTMLTMFPPDGGRKSIAQGVVSPSLSVRWPPARQTSPEKPPRLLPRWPQASHKPWVCGDSKYDKPPEGAAGAWGLCVPILGVPLKRILLLQDSL